MKTQSIRDLLAAHDFFAGLPPAHLDVVAGCGTNIVVPAGSLIAREGDAADDFYVVREGNVSIETHLPSRPPLVVETVAPGSVVGWSWLVPPHRWSFDIRARDTVHAVALDGACLRGKCHDDPVLGYALLQRFASIIVARLESTRLRLLDVYGSFDA